MNLCIGISKASQDTNISAKILEAAVDAFVYLIFHECNNSIELPTLPPGFQLGNIKPVTENGMRYDNDKNSLVSNKPNLSMAFERCVKLQMSASFHGFFSKGEYGFRKEFSVQQCLDGVVHENYQGLQISATTRRFELQTFCMRQQLPNPTVTYRGFWNL